MFNNCTPRSCPSCPAISTFTRPGPEESESPAGLAASAFSVPDPSRLGLLSAIAMIPTVAGRRCHGPLRSTAGCCCAFGPAAMWLPGDSFPVPLAYSRGVPKRTDVVGGNRCKRTRGRLRSQGRQCAHRQGALDFHACAEEARTKDSLPGHRLGRFAQPTASARPPAW